MPSTTMRPFQASRASESRDRINPAAQQQTNVLCISKGTRPFLTLPSRGQPASSSHSGRNNRQAGWASHAAKDSQADPSPCSKARQRRRQRLHSVHCYIAQTGVAAVAASAAAMLGHRSGEEEEEEASEVQSGTAHGPAAFRVTLGSFGKMISCMLSWIHGLLGCLVRSIGHPPRMPLQASDPPTALLWLIDLCLLLLLASFILFVLAFTATGTAIMDECVGAVESRVQDMNHCIGQSMEMEDGKATVDQNFGRAKVIIVVALSTFSGGLLNVKHAIRSAVFCGF